MQAHGEEKFELLPLDASWTSYFICKDHLPHVEPTSTCRGHGTIGMNNMLSTSKQRAAFVSFIIFDYIFKDQRRTVMQQEDAL